MLMDLLKFNTQNLYPRVLPKLYLLVGMLLFTVLLFGQDTLKLVPDGTTGLVLEIRPTDYLTKKRAPNEFEGTYSTIRIGFGYIADAAAYSLSSDFKKQMDSAKLDFKDK